MNEVKVTEIRSEKKLGFLTSVTGNEVGDFFKD